MGTSVSAPATADAARLRTEAAILRMARAASIEVSVKSRDVVADCARWLPPGAEVFICMVPGQTYHQTAQMAGALVNAGFTPVPHVTARTIVNAASARDIFVRLAGAGVRRALLLGGERAAPAGEYDSALSLLRSDAFEALAAERVYVAGYPDGHPSIADDVLDRQLADKLALCAARGIEAGVVTQFTFDEKRLIAWLDQTAAQYPGALLVAGVAGPAGAGTLLRYAARCGVRASMSMLTRHAEKIMHVLSESGPEALIYALAQREADTGRATGLHLFSFGGTARTARWRRALADGYIELRTAETTFEVLPH